MLSKAFVNPKITTNHPSNNQSEIVELFKAPNHVNLTNSSYPFLSAFSSANLPTSMSSVNGVVSNSFQSLNSTSYLPSYSTFLQNQNFYQQNQFHELQQQQQQHQGKNFDDLSLFPHQYQHLNSSFNSINYDNTFYQN